MEGEIYSGKIVKLESFGVFVDINGFKPNGLVHISQLAKDRVERPEHVVALDQEVFVKVLSVENGDEIRRKPKISLSMKYADQSTGADRDRNGIDAELEQRRKKSYSSGTQQPITLNSIYNTICTKCQGKGHLASECFNVDGATYELVSEGEEETKPVRNSEESIAKSVGRGRGATLPSWVTHENTASKRRRLDDYNEKSFENGDYKRDDKKRKKDRKEKKDKHKHKHKKDKKGHKGSHKSKKKTKKVDRYLSDSSFSGSSSNNSSY